MPGRPRYAELVAQADAATAGVVDPEMKRIAFEKTLDDLRASDTTNWLDSAAKLIQAIVVVVGVVVSVLSFNAARDTEAHATKAQAEAKSLEFAKYRDQRENELIKRKAEGAKPFLELRQRLYSEAVQTAAVLGNPKDHSEDEIKKAKKRFRELYVAELSLVEGLGVEEKMVGLAKAVDRELLTLTAEQLAALDLAHALRDSLVRSWGVDEEVVDNPNP